MKFVFFTLTFLCSFISLAQGPSEDNCDFYDEVEQQYQCGSKGYALSYGKKYCQRYLSVETNMSSDVQEWFPKVRFCLQKYLDDNFDNIRDCEELRHKAIGSHFNCYVKT